MPAPRCPGRFHPPKGEQQKAPSTPQRPRTPRKRFQVSPQPGAAIQIEYWDQRRQVTSRFNLRRIELLCLVVAVGAAISTALGRGLDAGSTHIALRFLELLLKPST